MHLFSQDKNVPKSYWWTCNRYEFWRRDLKIQIDQLEKSSRMVHRQMHFNLEPQGHCTLHLSSISLKICLELQEMKGSWFGFSNICKRKKQNKVLSTVRLFYTSSTLVCLFSLFVSSFPQLPDHERWFLHLFSLSQATKG